jgi:RND family efflux transporter MFP subunit
LRLSAAALVLLAVLIVVTGLLTRRAEAAKLRERADDDSVRTVSVISPSRAGQGARLELPGRIEAHTQAPIYARISGYLKRWTVDIGAHVKAGELMAEIETPDLDQQLLQSRAELASAKATAALAATTAKRWQALLATDAVSRQEVEEKTADLAAKQASVNALQANVDRYQAMKQFARIVAPFPGVVTARNIDVGALVSVGGAPGSELFTVSDIGRLRVYVSVPQVYVSVVKAGTKARLSVPENPGKFYAATVQSRAQAISAGSGSMLVQLTADNPEAELLPGEFATVGFDQPTTPGTLSIPPSALIFNKNGLSVGTVGADDKVVLKRVTVARDLGSSIEIATGLAPDDRVIESPPDGVANGDPVRVAAEGAPSKPQAAKR